MKRFLIHDAREPRELRGVWASNVEFAYLPGEFDAQDIGMRAMAARRQPDWDEWCDTLLERYPIYLWWNECYVDDNETAVSLLRKLQAADEGTFSGLDPKDGYDGPTPEQGILPDKDEYQRIQDMMWAKENPILSALMQAGSDEPDSATGRSDRDLPS
ncbi:MAG: hypothetical protein WCP28_07455 [Actinomycetes bacterium]